MALPRLPPRGGLFVERERERCLVSLCMLGCAPLLWPLAGLPVATLPWGVAPRGRSRRDFAASAVVCGRLGSASLLFLLGLSSLALADLLSLALADLSSLALAKPSSLTFLS